MKITLLEEPKIIMSNPDSPHNYFGWPTAARLKDGRIAVAASGFRLRHICPFGKAVISYSTDEGETYTAPVPIIDTSLDDRDGGITPFGDSGVLFSSFNNTVNFQRQHSKTPYDIEHLNKITPEDEVRDLGSVFRISFDNGKTFGEIFKSPVTSPHGPIDLCDGSLLWVGRTFSAEDAQIIGKDRIEAHKVNLDGTTEFVGAIKNVDDGKYPPLSCEPHTLLRDDGSLITLIRVQRFEDERMFTIFKSESFDKGHTWTDPVQILDRLGGSPPHMLKTSSGLLVCTYGYREAPFGVRVIFSNDDGNTWSAPQDLYVNGVCGDLGYPSSVELYNGDILTVFYAHPTDRSPAVIMQQKWRIEND